MPESPYGTWRSPVGAGDAACAVSLRMVALNDGTLWWQERHPDNDGRISIMRHTPDGDTTEIFAAQATGTNAGAGIGEWLPISHSAVVAAGEDSQRLYLLHQQRDPQSLTPENTDERVDCYTDLLYWPQSGQIWCVRQSWREDVTEQSIVAVPLDGAQQLRTLLTTTDRLAAVRPSPDAALLAWIAWPAPQMPWDGCELRVGRITVDGLTEVRTVLGGPVEAVFQPEWAARDSLYVISDRSRWWNPYQVWLDGSLRSLCLVPEEFGWPLSQRGLSTYGQLSDGQLAVLHGTGNWRLDLLDPNDSTLTPLELPYTAWQPSLHTSGTLIAGVAGTPMHPAAVVVIDAANGEHQVIRQPTPDPPRGYRPRAYPTTFVGRDGHQVHALVYPPHNPQARAASEERIPYLLVLSGAPGSQVPRMLELAWVFFTSRGLGITVVDCRGSGGYGRSYREQIHGQWGIADVEDCAVVAHGLAARWHADPARLVVRGQGRRPRPR